MSEGVMYSWVVEREWNNGWVNDSVNERISEWRKRWMNWVNELTIEWEEVIGQWSIRRFVGLKKDEKYALV